LSSGTSESAEPSLLEDFLSDDTRCVMHATWQVIRTRDAEALDPLVAALPRIRRATDHLDLGGALHSNRVSLEHALEKIENHRDKTCWCANYPGLSFYEPSKEEKSGYVRILSTSEPGWSMTYRCVCVLCGQEFEVEQGDYHYTWWKWVPRGLTRRKRT
jgi:hypothetical protein